VPPVNLTDVSPALAPSIREYLGIESTTFSLSYVDTKVGTGDLAAPHKWYSVQYTGYLTDGTVFDASSKHPNSAPFVLQQGAHMVIPGWDTGFYGMHVGGKRRLFIPHQLAYGSRANGPVPANADLIFDIELVSQSDSNPTPPPAAATPAKPATPTPGPAATAPATPPPAATPPSPATTPAPAAAPKP
jgi:peptidylprolyl isomerase